MTFAQIRQAVAQECNKEKKIFIRNTIFCIVLVLLVSYFAYQSEAVCQYFITSRESALKVLTFVGPLLAIIILSYTIITLYKTFGRLKKSNEILSHIENGGDFKIFGTVEHYKTILPLIWIKLKLDPITYLQISTGTKLYDVPIPSELEERIKIGLYKKDESKLNHIKDLVFHSKQIDTPAENIAIPSQEAYKTFADVSFTEDIASMENTRKMTKNMFFVQIIAIIIFLPSFFYYISSQGMITEPIMLYKIIGILIGFCLLMYLFVYKFLGRKNAPKYSDYTQFKKSVYSRLVAFINPNFEYIESGFIGLSEFLHSGMFYDKDYAISGSDQIYGIYNGVPFINCNLNVSYRPQFRQEKTKDDIVFSGNYMTARFNKTFNYPIYIYPKLSFFESINTNDIENYLDLSIQKVVLEDPEFNQQFNVYCDDQIMARYVLTPAFMERLKKINQDRKGTLYIAINDRNIVLANNTANNANVLENVTTSMFRKIDRELLDDLYNELTTNLQMIDTLKLNVNIWK